MTPGSRRSLCALACALAALVLPSSVAAHEGENHPPECLQTSLVASGTARTINLPCMDPDGDAITVALGPTNSGVGTLTDVSHGAPGGAAPSVTYNPNGHVGGDNFAVDATDAHGATTQVPGIVTLVDDAAAGCADQPSQLIAASDVKQLFVPCLPPAGEENPGALVLETAIAAGGGAVVETGYDAERPVFKHFLRYAAQNGTGAVVRYRLRRTVGGVDHYSLWGTVVFNVAGPGFPGGGTLTCGTPPPVTLAPLAVRDLDYSTVCPGALLVVPDLAAGPPPPGLAPTANPLVLSYTAPAAPGQYSFSLVGFAPPTAMSAPFTQVVNVENASGNQPPNCKPDTAAEAEPAGDPVVIAVTCSDPDGDELTYVHDPQDGDTAPARGDLSAITRGEDGSATITYTPHEETDPEQDVFTVTATDESGASAQRTVWVSLDGRGPNLPPSCTVPEGQALTVAPGRTLDVYVTCEDETINTVGPVLPPEAGPHKGTIDVGTSAPDDPPGMFRLVYSAHQDAEAGDDPITLRFFDGRMFSHPVVLPIAVTPPGPPACAGTPVDHPDHEHAVTLPARPVRSKRTAIVVLACEPETFDATQTQLDEPSAGTADLDPDGENFFLFTPPSGLNGPATVEYTVHNEHGATHVLQPLDVRADANTQPLCAQDDPGGLHTRVGETVSVEVACVDFDGDMLRGQAAVAPPSRASATVVERSEGRRNAFLDFVVDVAGRAAGGADLHVGANDGALNSPAVLIPLSVRAADQNAPPECYAPAVEDAFVGGETEIYPSCFDADGDELTVSVPQDGETAPKRGHAEHINHVDGGTAVSYRGTQAGSEAFIVTVSDGHGGTVPVELAFTVQPTPAPDCGDDPPPVRLRPGATRVINLRCGPPGGVPVAYAFSGPGAERVEWEPGDRHVLYTAADADETFSYVATIGGVAGPTVTQTIDADASVNSVPECTIAEETAPIRRGGSRRASILCTDPDGDAIDLDHTSATNGMTLTDFTEDASPFGGTVGELTMTLPAEGTAGQAWFEWLITETSRPGAVGRRTQMVEIREPGTNHAPVCDRADSAVTRAGRAVTFAVFCDDPERDALTLAKTRDPQLGTIGAFTKVEGDSTYEVTYTPDPEEPPGDDEFRFVATDSHGAESWPGALDVHVAGPEENTPPACEDSFGSHVVELTVPAGTAASVPLPPCFDREGDPYTWVHTSTPSQGTFADPRDASPRYTAARTATFGGARDDTFTVVARDDQGVDRDSLPITVDVDITEPPPGPQLTFSAFPASTRTNVAARTFSWSSDDAGVTFACKLDGATVACPPEGETTVTLTPTSDQNGAPHKFEVTASDGSGGTTTDSHTWTLDAVAPDTGAVTGGSGFAGTRTHGNGFAFGTFTGTEGDVAGFECRVFKNGTTRPQFAGPCPTSARTILVEGEYTFQLRAVDPAGNADATPSEFAFTIDRTPPAGSVTASPDTAVTGDPARTFTYPIEDGATYQCVLDGTTLDDCDGATTVDAAEGRHFFHVVATDAVGNSRWMTGNSAYEWVVDLTDPETNGFFGGIPPRTRQTSINFATFSSPSGDVTGFQCRLERGGTTVIDWAACPADELFTGLQEGTQRVSVRAVDAAGNVDETPSTHSWTIDLTGPNTAALAGGPPARTKQTSATFDAFTTDPAASDLARFECRKTRNGTVEEDWMTCHLDRTWSGLLDGSHELQVRAVDDLGNADASPSSAAWVVDNAGPEVSLTATPEAARVKVAKRFVFSSPAGDAQSITCTYDGSALPASECDGDFTLLPSGPTANGEHTFTVRATDDLGNQGAAASHTWTHDAIAPDTGALSGVPSRTKATSATFAAFTSPASDVARYECRLDGAAEFSACPESRTFSGLGEGSHTLRVRAVDDVGNADDTPSETTWTVDLTGAVVQGLGSASPAVTNAAARTITWTSEEGATFTCTFDGVPFEDCDGSAAVTAAGNGPHTFKVIATDAVGNAGASATHAWTLDTVAPDTGAIATGLPARTRELEIAFPAFSATGGADAFQCRLNPTEQSVWTSCGDRTFTGVANQLNTLEVRAVDAAGNADGSPSSFSWTIDRTAPDTGALSAIASPTNQTSVTFGAFTSPASDVARYECRLDAAAEFSTCPESRTFSGLGEGSHTLRVRAVDDVGNADETPAERTWDVDLTTPAAPSLTANPATALTNVASRTLTYSGEAGATFACTLDGEAVEDCDGATTVAPSAQGAHTFAVRARDAAGNLSAPVTAGWTLDTVDPDTFIVSAPSGETKSRSKRVVGRSNDATAAIECRFDGAGEWAACPSSGELPLGAHFVEVRAVDPAGNADETPARSDWEIKDDAPVTTAGSITPDAPLSTAPPAAEPTPEQPVLLTLDSPIPATVAVTERTAATTAEPQGFGFVGYEISFDSDELDESLPEGQQIELEFEIHRAILAAGGITEDNLQALQVFRDGQLLPSCPAAACVQSIAPIGSGASFVGARVRVLTDHLSDWNFGIDDAAPGAPTVGGTSGEDADGDVAFTYAGEQGATFECRLGTGAFEPCPAGGKGYSGLADGAYAFEVRAVDAAKNRGAAASRAFTVKRPAKKDDEKKADDKKPAATPPADAPKPPAPVPPRVTPPRGLSVSLLSAPTAKLAAALRTGVQVGVQCSAACRVDATLSIPGALAKKLKLAKDARKPVVVATGRASGTGRVIVKLAFTAKAKKALRKQRSLRLSLGGTAAGAGVPVALKGSLTVKK